MINKVEAAWCSIAVQT